MNKLQIYRASAGSGKTYLLTENYLKLAFESPNNFSKILAVTFTNKAAEEMKTRILEELSSIINLKEKANHFKSIKQHLNFKLDTDMLNRAIKVRDNILHNYSLFNVSTIDSFVQKVIRAFSYEMNLNSGYDVELDTDKVINDLTELLYNSISENKHLQNWLITFAEHKINEGRNWDFREEINTLSKEIFKEKFQELYFDKFNVEDEREKLNKLKESLLSIKNKFEKKMNQLSAEYKSIIDSFGINYETQGAKFRTISNHFLKKIPEKKYDDITKALKESIDGFENWHNKTATQDVIDTLQNVYEKLLKTVKRFFEIFNNENKLYYSAIHVLKNFHSFGILNDTAAFLPEYRNDNNLLLISDTTLLLKKIIGKNDAPFIYEKIGNRFKNILIDEFQDTSGFQWESFKPLISNSLSEGLYNLIVGDIKQSIYRWRGGDWKLLLKGVKKDIGENITEEKTLEINWRSKENIIKFNNTIFKILPEILQNRYNKELENINNSEILNQLTNADYNKILVDAYDKNCQDVPDSKDKKGGKIQINFIKKDDENEKDNFPKLIDNLIKNKKYNPKDIGILVRKNKQAKKVVDLLLDYQNDNKNSEKYQIISNDSLYIGNSTSVKLIICAMKYIHNKSDELNLAQMIYEYQNIKTNYEINYNNVFLSVKNGTWENKIPNQFISDTNKLSKKSVFELTEEIIRIFNLNKQKNEFIYFRSFQNLVSDFSRNRNSDLSEFLRWWNEKGKTKSIQISDKVDAVKVMTIHKSKGLAFNIVILPFADWGIDHTGTASPLLWTHSETAPFNSFKYLPVRYSKSLENTIFSKDYFNEKLFAYTDALNMLYVAFTRAKTELHIFSTYKPNNKTDIKDVGQLLYEAINSNKPVEDENCKSNINLNKYFNTSDGTFLINENHKINIDSENKDKPKTQINEIPESKEYPNNNWQDKVKINYGSEDFFIESLEAVEEKVNYGTLMHQIFAEIKTEKDIEPSLQKMYYNGYITKEEKADLKEKITKIISNPQVKEWFSSKYEVRNEEALLTLKGNIKIPDRVLISDNKAIVIDFKFGKQQEKYKEQISEYKKLIEEVYELNTKAYIFYVEEDTIVNI
ncbi:MAG: UvrD-helicase domain-containing protein [Bacteroidales bacterium]|nr:UvrD-helicase domain-containing protein [Bacteroidales bacterium]